MLPAILAAIQLAQQKAQSQNQAANQLAQNRVTFNGQPNQINMLPQQSNGLGNYLSTISSIYGMKK